MLSPISFSITSHWCRGTSPNLWRKDRYYEAMVRSNQPEFEKLEVPDLPVGVVAAVSQQAVAEKAAVLVDEQLLAAVDIDQH